MKLAVLHWFEIYGPVLNSLSSYFSPFAQLRCLNDNYSYSIFVGMECFSSRTIRGEQFIHSDHFYSTSSSPLLLRGAPDTAWILCQNFTPKCHRQLWVKDLPKVPMWRLDWELNPWPFGRKASTLPMLHTCPNSAWTELKI